MCRQYTPCPIHKRPSASRQGYGASWRKIRQAALERDNHRCTRCGSTVRLNVDHRIPRSMGGDDSLSNLTTLCASCHSRKTARHDGGFGR
jgi:5-methylcytosine-specific restriction protein A